MTTPPPTHLARLKADRTTAMAVVEALGETLDAADAAVAVFEAPDGGWTVELTLRDAPDQAALRTFVAGVAGQEVARTLAVETVAARDWVAASLAGLTPVRAGRFFVHGRHDRGRLPANRIGIEIEAALAFGTGHHGTTRGCLLALDAIAKRMSRRPLDKHPTRRVALDLGTGSGLLAIAAAKALRRPALATDIDEVAVRTARTNAARNGAAPLIEVMRVSGVTARRIRARGPYRLVLANILLAPLKRFAAPLSGLLAGDARIVLSGLLANQENAALWPYRSRGLFLERRIVLEGWVTLVLRRGAKKQSPRAGPRGAMRNPCCRRFQRTKGSLPSFR